MNVAILHHHLRRGGVTQVIANHLRSLDAYLQQRPESAAINVALFHGGDTSGWPGDILSQLKRVQVTMHVVEGLQYDRPRSEGKQIHEAVTAECNKLGWRMDETVLHVHNHTLGKSLAMPEAVRCFAEAKSPLLLQIHDFAEDFRPQNYRKLATVGDELAGIIYPQASHIRYAVLNRRDFKALTQAGVAADQLALLPNPVSSFGEPPDKNAARKLATEKLGLPAGEITFAVYPVRGIARKNLGETLLYTALGDGAFWAGLTLAPKNPAEQPLYDHWRQLAAELNLPMLFGIGENDGLTFAENLAAADVLLTTSVAEGFGMVFLEANFADRPLVGRNLPEITADFVDSGMQFPGLRQKLNVPVNWVGEQAFRDSISQEYEATRAVYGLPSASPDFLRQQCDEMLAVGMLDFAQLNVNQQTAVIERVSKNATARDELFSANDGLEDVIAGRRLASAELLEQNRDVVRKDYSELAIGERLHTQYIELADTQREEAITPVANAATLLDFFLNIKRLNPVRLATTR